jgi:hypothetical protein
MRDASHPPVQETSMMHADMGFMLFFLGSLFFESIF